jgi:hypothetical protein
MSTIPKPITTGLRIIPDGLEKSCRFLQNRQKHVLFLSVWLVFLSASNVRKTGSCRGAIPDREFLTAIMAGVNCEWSDVNH